MDSRMVYEPSIYAPAIVTIFRSGNVRVVVNSADEVFVENIATKACSRCIVRGDGVFVVTGSDSALEVSMLNGVPSVKVLPPKLHVGIGE